MPHKWEIHVNAGSYYPDLSNNFFGNDIHLSYENDDHCGMQFSAYSPHIDELTDANAVAARIFSLQLLLNGALSIESGRRNPVPVSFDSFHNLEGGNSSRACYSPIEEYPFRADSPSEPRPAGAMDPKRRVASYLLYLSKSDESIRNLLFLAGLLANNSPVETILSWATLYRIHDCAKTYSADLGIAYDSLADKTEIERFTAACNNMSILGLNARHGETRNKPPKRVMTDYEEAEGLIIAMAKKLVDAYVSAKHP